jgi:hypothetical protein
MGAERHRAAGRRGAMQRAARSDARAGPAGAGPARGRLVRPGTHPGVPQATRQGGSRRRRPSAALPSAARRGRGGAAERYATRQACGGCSGPHLTRAAARGAGCAGQREPGGGRGALVAHPRVGRPPPARRGPRPPRARRRRARARPGALRRSAGGGAPRVRPLPAGSGVGRCWTAEMNVACIRTACPKSVGLGVSI